MITNAVYAATVVLTLIVLSTNPAQAEECDAQCQAVRNAQDPLADVKAVMTDNTISFGTADEQTGYGFQIQPVYSIPTEYGFNFIARGIIPIAGVHNGAAVPQLGPNQIGGTGYTWGLSDVILQGFFVPQIEGLPIKFGVGPQVSLRSRTDSVVGGPGWGAGLAAVAFGFAGDLSYGGIFGHHWGQNSFSLSTIQPIVFYNTQFLGGSYFGYNNSITYDWSAKAGNRWQVPVGLTVGKTFVLESGTAIDANFGGYGLAAHPEGGADAQFKFGISVFF
ncbi:hypothetical protein [Roseibium sp.]|uniref:hypothetical protein n=1 Tax=Roseibium sp. TaxID=1936156 RepID=UPI003B52D5C8